ncbi:MAG TPA: NFACT RNA binding domain-containing protein [Bacteroidia bacterium]|nr:NFACT RNA binding domain-containing protein [Bacteroidia bacterium]
MNHNNYFFLRQLTAELDKQLKGALFVEAYSASKQELLLLFKTKSGEYFPFKFSFLITDTVLSFPAEASSPKHKHPHFRALVSQEVVEVKQHTPERSFHILFANNYYLFIKLFGKNGNVILVNNNQPEEIFRRQIKADQQLDFGAVNTAKRIETNSIIQADSAKSLQKQFPFIPADAVEVLENKGFFTSPEEIRKNTLSAVLNTLENPTLYISKAGNNYQLRFFPAGETLAEYTEPITAVNDFARLYLGKYFFEDKKNRIVQTLKQRKEKLEKEITSKKVKLETIATQTPYKHIADILMANLYQLQKGLEKVNLHDFYTDKEIEIRLKKELSPQENAENYYRKAKNQVKETTVLKENLEKAETELTEITAKLDNALSAADSKALRGMEKDRETVEESSRPSLFKEFEMEGYTILVGKNSENNDVLTQKYAHKNDIWLHARGMAGSHVVIKHKPGKTVPINILGYAASLAAYFSKGRTDSLCPVIYTEKKYVRKPKGSAPGQVTVEKENVLLVKPAFSGE